MSGEATDPNTGVPNEPSWTELKESLDQLNTLWERDVKSIQEKAKENGETLAELKERDPVAKDQLEGVTTKLNELEMRLNRPGQAIAPEDEVKNDELWGVYFGEKGHSAPRDEVTPERVREAKRAFRDYLRKGDERMAPEEVKLLSTQDAANGGYLVYPEFAQEIIKDLTEISRVRSIARVQQTATNVFKVPKRLTLPSAAWVGEGDTDEQSESTYGIEEIPNGTMRATSKATREQLGDAAFDMEAQIREDFSEAFSSAEGLSFVTGDGVGKPEGFMTNPDVDGSTITGSASAVTYTGLVNLAHGLNANYIAQARYVMNLRTLGDVRLLEDGAGNLLFQPASADMPSTITGWPFTILQDMPAVAAGNYPVAFGDFRRAYRIIERVMFDLLRDPYTAKRDGAVEFTGFMRVGGQVVLASAIRKLEVSS